MTEQIVRNQEIEEFLKLYNEQVREIVNELRVLIQENIRDAEERLHVGWKNLTYYLHRHIVSIAPLKNSVNLYFFQGVKLTDERKLLQGSGKSMRHLKVFSIDDIDKQNIIRFIQEAIQIDKEFRLQK